MGIENQNFDMPDAVEPELTPEDAVESERDVKRSSLIEKIKRSSSRVANALMLVTALSSAPGVVKDVEAQVVNGSKNEEIKKNITESGSWAKDMLNRAKASIPKLKTAEDAEWFMRTEVGEFVMEWHQPSKGNIKEGVYGLNERVSTDHDLDLILSSAVEMDNIIDQINSKFPNLPSYKNQKENLKKMIASYEDQTSYSGKQKRKIIDEHLR